MTLGFNQVIAPKPIHMSVESQSVANALMIMAGLPRGGGDERHIGINEWVDRVRLSLSEEQLRNVTLVTWGLGVEGMLNVVNAPDMSDDFDLFLHRLHQVPADVLRDTCLYWMLNSVHRAVFQDADPFTSVGIDDLLVSRERFRAYLDRNIVKEQIGTYVDELTDLYFDPDGFKTLALTVLSDLWNNYFREEWLRNKAEIDRVVKAFSQVDTSGMATFEAIQVITGRDLRAIFRADELAKFEKIIFIPSKHNGPYVMWFGNKTTFYIIFTAQMPKTTLLSGDSKPDLNVLIQRFKALSDDNRMQVLLTIREQGELSTQDIIDQFDLNKSAASRYLGQLFANGFILERRDPDGRTKYYSVNNDMIDAFLASIAQLLKH